MLYIFALFVLCSLVGISFKKIKTIDAEALSHDRTIMINGIFVAIILFSHFNGYVLLTSASDEIYLKIFSNISQLMVTTFLFYSGYGIIESIKRKPGYIKSFFKNRILKLFIMYAAAIVLYIILNLIIGKSYSVSTILLSFTGWTDIGNSNWFIFVTFVLYFFIWLSFIIFKKDNYKATLLTLLLTLIYIAFMAKTGIRKGTWFNTVLCFNMGMFISLYKDRIMNFLKDNMTYILTFGCLLLIFLVCHSQGNHYIIYSLKSVVFVILIMMLSMKIKIGNKLLFFLGKNTFPIYILQRLSFIAYKNLGLLGYNIYVYFFVSVLTTIIIAIIFNKLLKLLFNAINIKA